jgi:hypothetical protein
LTANSIADMRLKYCSFRGGRAPGRIRLDRVAEEVAVVQLRPAAEAAHLLAQLRLDERVDDDGGPAPHPFDGEPQVGDRLDARMADLLEVLIRELRLERGDEPRGGLAGRVGDDVQLDGRSRHVRRRLTAPVRAQLAGEAPPAEEALDAGEARAQAAVGGDDPHRRLEARRLAGDPVVGALARRPDRARGGAAVEDDHRLVPVLGRPRARRGDELVLGDVRPFRAEHVAGVDDHVRHGTRVRRMRTLLLAGLVALLAAARAAAADPLDGAFGGTYTTPDGAAVRVFTSADYPADPTVNQRWADYLASLVHGPELASVTLLLLPVAQLQRTCGFGALACYEREDAFVYAPEEAPPEGPSPEELVAHEYGHHVEATRSNPPWNATTWGTKRWATAMGVCAGVAAGRLHPGDEASAYKTNPGEAFAEAYRLLNEEALGLPPSPWSQVSRSLMPGPEALAALREDVLAPYAGPTRVAFAGTFRRGGANTLTFTVRTPLDGRLRVHLATVGVQARLTLDGRARSSELVCGERTVTATVVRANGYGRVALVASVP